MKTPQEIRRQLYKNIIDETMFVSRASEGAISPEWLWQQPVFIRKEYVKQLSEEIKERQERLNKRK